MLRKQRPAQGRAVIYSIGCFAISFEGGPKFGWGGLGPQDQGALLRLHRDVAGSLHYTTSYREGARGLGTFGSKQPGWQLCGFGRLVV